jgi:hypothetical protein
MPAACASSAFGTTPIPMTTICAGSRSPVNGTAAETRPFSPSSRAIVVPVRMRTPVASSRCRTWLAMTGATARPSSRSTASTTVTLRPAAVSVAAISSPMKPPPRMTTSSLRAPEVADQACIGERAQRHHACKVGTRQRQNARSRTGRQDEPVERQHAAACISSSAPASMRSDPDPGR